MDQATITQSTTYHIRIKEALDRSTISWFGEITIAPQENGESLLVGQFADQSALRGFMDRLWNLNFTILYLERIESEKPEQLMKSIV